MEDWLYEDGEDETKGVYVAKLEELKKVRTSVVLQRIFFLPNPSLFLILLIVVEKMEVENLFCCHI